MKCFTITLYLSCVNVPVVELSWLHVTWPKDSQYSVNTSTLESIKVACPIITLCYMSSYSVLCLVIVILHYYMSTYTVLHVQLCCITCPVMLHYMTMLRDQLCCIT